MVVKDTASQSVLLQQIRISEMEVSIKGITPLIVHRFSEKAKKQIEDKQQKKAKEPRGARNPTAEYRASFYMIKGEPDTAKAQYGIPAIWFKQAAIYACTYLDLTKVAARGAFHILGEVEGLIPLKYKSIRMREDYVTIGQGTRDIRYRGEFSGWSCKLRIRYNGTVFSAEQIINLINMGGFCSGLGEMRPSQQCSDQYGMYEVSTRTAG